MPDDSTDASSPKRRLILRRPGEGGEASPETPAAKPATPSIFREEPPLPAPEPPLFRDDVGEASTSAAKKGIRLRQPDDVPPPPPLPQLTAEEEAMLAPPPPPLAPAKAKLQPGTTPPELDLFRIDQLPAVDLPAPTLPAPDLPAPDLAKPAPTPKLSAEALKLREKVPAELLAKDEPEAPGLPALPADLPPSPPAKGGKAPKPTAKAPKPAKGRGPKEKASGPRKSSLGSILALVAVLALIGGAVWWFTKPPERELANVAPVRPVAAPAQPAKSTAPASTTTTEASPTTETTAPTAEATAPAEGAPEDAVVSLLAKGSWIYGEKPGIEVHGAVFRAGDFVTSDRTWKITALDPAQRSLTLQRGDEAPVILKP